MCVDFWYGNTFADVADIDCFFYPNAGTYRGNMYDATGKIIGDYSTRDSMKVSAAFPFFRWKD